MALIDDYFVRITTFLFPLRFFDLEAHYQALRNSLTQFLKNHIRPGGVLAQLINQLPKEPGPRKRRRR